MGDLPSFCLAPLTQELVGTGYNLANVLKALRDQDAVPGGYYSEVACDQEGTARVASAVIHSDQARGSPWSGVPWLIGTGWRTNSAQRAIAPQPHKP
jgi:hypothetical protein